MIAIQQIDIYTAWWWFGTFLVFALGRIVPSDISWGDFIIASWILYHVIRDTYGFISFYRGFIRHI